ncbi:hypothetical protein [Ostreiculturibacter nitratireducens]|uniref:hypothetical protein n=1 Tax=Ostreiculturibacter nitratireducens TaxID=3075226 RepID=UPI0031B5AD98
MVDARQAERARALIARIEAATRKELDRLRAEAEEEAASAVRTAHRRARERVHEDIENLRRRRADAARQETARLDTLRRQLRQREAGALIEDGVPALEAAFTALWADAEARKAWVAAAVRAASERLVSRDWVIEHPKDWSEAERKAAAEEVVERTGKAPDFEVATDLEAGVRLCAGNACLDAGIEALMGDANEAGAALLAEIERGREGTP